jgi:hypothetical protein
MRDDGTTPTLITEWAPTTMAGAGRTRDPPGFWSGQRTDDVCTVLVGRGLMNSGRPSAERRR